MKNYLKKDEWLVIEEGFDPELNRISESVFSLGNGRMGLRGNFEEAYSGDTLRGSYVAGVYYPDKTKVGWWKNGYPEYFAKVLNASNWIGINIHIYQESLDLAHAEVGSFRRELNMREGYLLREFTAKMLSGKEVRVRSKRFCSIADDEAGAVEYSLTPLNFSGDITISPYIDFDVENEDSNYGEKFWEEVAKDAEEGWAYVTASTKKTGFHVCTAMRFDVSVDGARQEGLHPNAFKRYNYVSQSVKVSVQQGQEVVVHKYAVNLSSENHDKSVLPSHAKKAIERIHKKGFAQLMQEQAEAWARKWEECDIVVKGDVAAQQGIRFNIFQLNQTYTGEDERLNIGPKGFTGEKYGGVTYWDTEAYCLPFYLSTADSRVARNLLRYRHKHLPKAIENAQKLGFKAGAALYPMVTMNGEECHNEWEITFEEIHRNGAIAYAIFDYIRYTDDKAYLAEYGLEVLIAISRFWAQRINFSQQKNAYVMLGVTGPNEYENNVNNNWYTNTIATWVLQYTLESVQYVKETDAKAYKALAKQVGLREQEELPHWQDIIDRMYYPESKELGIFLQQDNYLDKEQLMAHQIPADERPIWQNWSWDRILRSCFIKQADVLQGLYFLEERYDEDTIRRNFDFYEPRTVHESSLSPCVHAILAARLGMEEKAYEMYIRTARLDLDDINNDTEDGCHITSMAGTWMAFVKGFGGLRVRDGRIAFAPMLPKQWEGYSFKVGFRGHTVKVSVGKGQVTIKNLNDSPLAFLLYGEAREVGAQSEATFPMPARAEATA
jgi:maltose phosphorylase